MRPLDIAIAGCGPAGLAAALCLSRDGHRITLFDQFDTPGPVGSGLMLQETGLAVLGELGLRDRMVALGRRIDRLLGQHATSGRVVLDVRYKAFADGLHGVAVHRAALFHVLFDAARQAGLQVMGAHIVEGAQQDQAGKVYLRIREKGRQGPFDLVIDALGARSRLRPGGKAGADFNPLAYGALWTTLPWPGAPFSEHHLEQRYERASVMIGVLPVGMRHEGDDAQVTFFWSIKPDDYERWRAAGLDAWKGQVRRLWPQTDGLLQQIKTPDQLVMARYSHHTMRHPVSGSIVHIGDSAHAASPQLGQGANMALLDAWALAAALRGADNIAHGLARYAASRAMHVRLYQALTWMFTPFYQSDSRVLPLIRDLLVAPAARMPLVPAFLAQLVAGLLGNPLKSLGLEAST